jgi:hypothetical protein
MVRSVSQQGAGEGTGGRRSPHRAAWGIRTQACTLLLAGTMATVVPAVQAAVPGIKAAGGRPGPAVSRVLGDLYAVAFTSPRNGWAVGVTNCALCPDGTLIEHWNGTTWQRVPSPYSKYSENVPNASLFGVAVTSARNAWAVGEYEYQDGNSITIRTLVLHWNGHRWTQVPSPSPGSSSSTTSLAAVAATSPASAWAVGQYYNGTTWRALVLHWNGRRWTQVPSPNPPFVYLSAVAATSPASAWAVGSYGASCPSGDCQALIEHWDGTTWRRVPSPARASGTRLFGVTATSARNAWAVGQTANTPLILHWDGTVWRRVPSPARTTGNTLHGVAALSARNAWAVGNYENGATSRALVLHWDGTTWKVTPTPGTADVDGLWDVTALSTTNAWTVGGGATTETPRPLIEHWNGTTWQRAPSP